MQKNFRCVEQFCVVVLYALSYGVPTIAMATNGSPAELQVVGEWQFTYRLEARYETHRHTETGSGTFTIKDAGVVSPNPIAGSGSMTATSWKKGIKYRVTSFWHIEDYDCPDSTLAEAATLEISGHIKNGNLRLKARIPGGMIEKRVNFPCALTITEPDIPIDTEVVTTGQKDRYHTLELDGFNIEKPMQSATFNDSGEGWLRTVTLTKLWGCQEEPPKAEIGLSPDSYLNEQKQIAVGRTGVELALINRKDKDCRDEAPVDDRVNTSKTDWQVIGVDAKTVEDAITIEWNTVQEGSAEFQTMIDDWAWHHDDPSVAGDALAVTVVRPTGETNVSADWFPATFHHWQTQLQPTTVNFAGIQVVERDAGGSTDGCWFEGSAYEKIPLDNEVFDVGLDNKYTDINGIGVDVIEYYREQGRAPCTIRLHQAMDVVVPDGENINYSTTWITISIGNDSISAGRNGENEDKPWP